jgi:hypothetical protein
MRTHQDTTDKKIGDKKTKTMSLFFCLQSFCRSILLTTLLAPLAMLQAYDAPEQRPNLGWKDISPKARGIAVLVRCWIGHGFG